VLFQHRSELGYRLNEQFVDSLVGQIGHPHMITRADGHATFLDGILSGGSVAGGNLCPPRTASGAPRLSVPIARTPRNVRYVPRFP
jgi:hypothetical protein